MNKKISKIIIGLVCSILVTSSFASGVLAADSVKVKQQVGTGVPPSDDGPSGSADITPPVISQVKVSPLEDRAYLSWLTNEHTSSELIWGLNTNYSVGIITDSNKLINHSAYITDLIANTKYYFRITETDAAGNKSEYKGSFTTLNFSTDSTVDNVSNFAIVPTQNSLKLSWTNPVNPNFDYVRLVRSTSFYPLDPLNGLVVYEGSAEKFEDKEVKVGVVYYYTIFAVNNKGMYSSGSVAKGLVVAQNSKNSPSGSRNDIPLVDLDFYPSLDPNIVLISADDFTYQVYGSGSTLQSGKIEASVGEAIKISIPTSKLYSETTALTAKILFEDGKETNATYLFARNFITNSYELVIPAFLNSGNNKIEILIFDAQKKVLQKLIIPFKVLEKNQSYLSNLLIKQSSTPTFNTYYFWVFILAFLLFIVLVIIILFLLTKAFLSKSRQKEDQL